MFYSYFAQRLHGISTLSNECDVHSVAQVNAQKSVFIPATLKSSLMATLGVAGNSGPSFLGVDASVPSLLARSIPAVGVMCSGRVSSLPTVDWDGLGLPSAFASIT